MLDKKYNHIEVEEGKYNEWIEKGYKALSASDINSSGFIVFSG